MEVIQKTEVRMTRFAAEQIVHEKEPYTQIVTEEEIKAASTPVNMKEVIKVKPIVDTANKCIVGVSG